MPDRRTAVEALRRLTVDVPDWPEAGEFPAQDIDTTVQLVNACLSGRLVPDDPAAREQAIEATEAFVLRAVGADVPSPALSR